MTQSCGFPSCLSLSLPQPLPDPLLAPFSVRPDIDAVSSFPPNSSPITSLTLWPDSACVSLGVPSPPNNTLPNWLPSPNAPITFSFPPVVYEMLKFPPSTHVPLLQGFFHGPTPPFSFLRFWLRASPQIFPSPLDTAHFFLPLSK